MKKLIPILLALLLMVGLMPTAAFAAEEKSETFIYDGSNKVEGDYFNLEARTSSEKGWNGGNSYYIAITAKKGVVRITHVDAHVNNYGSLYDRVGVSGGQKVPESLGYAANTGDVSVININNKDFSFSGGDVSVNFDKITVYFETCEEDGHFYDSDNVCVVCGLTKCEVEGHSFDENNVCVCGLTKCEVEGHAYEKGVCTVCGDECKNEFHNGVYVCPDCLMEFDPTQGNPLVSGSTLSEGNMTIIFTIAALAIGLCGGFVIGRKKKPVLTDGTGAEDEE